MATAYHNLSDYDFNSVPDAKEMKFGIVVSEWNFNITGKLLEGAMNTLKKHGARDENILVKTVPGSFELIFGANQFIEYSNVDAVIAHSSPLLPSLPPARSSACSIVLVVINP